MFGAVYPGESLSPPNEIMLTHYGTHCNTEMQAKWAIPEFMMNKRGGKEKKQGGQRKKKRKQNMYDRMAHQNLSRCNKVVLYVCM